MNFQQACYFRLGEHTLALGGDTLRQIVTVGRVTPVPRTGPELLGLFTVRGLVVPLIDLRPIFDPAAARERVTERAALVEVDHHQIAFCLDDVYGFFPVQETFDPKTVDPRSCSLHVQDGDARQPYRRRHRRSEGDGGA